MKDIITLLAGKIADKNAHITDNNILNETLNERDFNTLKTISVVEFFTIVRNYNTDLANQIQALCENAMSMSNVKKEVQEKVNRIEKAEKRNRTSTSSYSGCTNDRGISGCGYSRPRRHYSGGCGYSSSRSYC